MTKIDVFNMGDESVARRLMSNQKLQQGSIYLNGAPAPSANQVAAVLHALADQSLLNVMVGEDVAGLADEHETLNRQASGLGRWFQGVADRLSFLR